ncbi:bifunctional RNase H/acid phosphatase [Kitasatospora purpeofusca]|uniref:bifunctional RNase H/acid phosphatase n=1 Tax=Kitasatospora purpeofusca TaxID=67352 RepID=UPI0022547B93|nr:bifunctional RNase H/acid phosphatase [Kitasatospora purpeofusca]MCX4752550.1 bifunctional RNase H/acid phosphatase [Kitasatospora purpeofusca]WSR32119.1 bifunctional RNase H/acid phosphatase [Kitasatospora purpeofusca]WSR40024.1 bifunctional RNase H/acid phosphatase [Kitasatospora purpeofusca]
MAGRRFVVEADGGSRGNPGPAGYGAVVRDGDTGQIIAEAAEFIGHATNNVAEYKGLIAGLRAARAIDPAASVDVRMDSKLVVEQMSGRWKIKHPDMQPLAAEAREVFPRGQVAYSWIPREKNKDADRLANEAMDAGKAGRQWEPRAPEAVTAVTGADEPGPPLETAAPKAGWAAPADLGTPTTFVLLRHGETHLTPEKRFSGSGGTDPELSEKGRWQAERAAEALAARGSVQAVVASPMLRTRQTAETVAARLGLEVRYEEGLREVDFGAWEGLTFGEVHERHPEDLAAWLGSARARPTGGGESFTTLTHRVGVARDKVLARYPGKTVLVVSHVSPIKTLVRLALGAPPDSLYRMELSAASICAVQYYADGNASLRLLNDTGHLR